MKILARSKALYTLLDKSRRRLLVALILLSLVGGILESLAFSTIAPVASGILSSEGGSTTLPFLGETSLQTALYLLVTAFFIRSAVLVLLSYMQATTVFNIQATISERLYKKYVELNSNAESQRNVSILAKNVIIEAQSIAQHGYVPMIAIASDTVIATILLAYIFWLNGIMLLWTFVIYVIGMYILASVVRGHLGRLGARRKEMDGYRHQYVNEAFDQKDLIFAHRLFPFFWQRYEEVNRVSAWVGGLQSGLNMSTRWIVEFLLILVFAGVILWNGGALPEISQLAVSAGIAIRLLPLSSKMLANLQRLDYSGPVLQELSDQLNAPPCKILRKEPTRDSGPGPYSLKFLNAKLRVENSGETYFDKEIDLSLEPGNVYVITGRNGVGKSTFIKVLLGSVLTDLCSGEMRLVASDGTYASLSPYDLTRSITVAFVPQEPVFIDATIRENLTHSVPCETEQLQELLELVGLRDYVNTLPKGLDTRMGDKYGYFSGGQRQRLAIARALFRESDILILDEPTSAADTAFTENLMPIIRSYAKNRVVLIISHGQDLCENCDVQLRLTETKMEVL